MDKKHRNLVAVLVAVVMAVALFSAFSVNWFHQTPSVILPTLTPTPSATSTPGAAGDYQRVEVTAETVQRVVATLERPASYARTVTVETVGEDGTVGQTTAQVVVDGGWTQVTATLPDGRMCHTIVGEEKRYVWYDDQRTWQEYPAQERTADLSQRLPTYEDVLALVQSDIVDARYASSGELPCIYVAVEEEELGYVEEYWVSVDTGLLVHAESRKGEDVFYRMSGYIVETPATAGLAFSLPDGTVLHATSLPG